MNRTIKIKFDKDDKMTIETKKVGKTQMLTAAAGIINMTSINTAEDPEDLCNFVKAIVIAQLANRSAERVK